MYVPPLCITWDQATWLYPCLVSSAGKVLVCLVGVRRFKPQPNQHSGSLNNWEESAAFVITSANG